MSEIGAIAALGDATRHRLYERICQGPCSVSELVATVPVSQPAVSRHLKVLREAGLVQVAKVAQKRIYRLDVKGIEEIKRYLDSLWDDALRAFGEEAERRMSETHQSDEAGG